MPSYLVESYTPVRPDDSLESRAARLAGALGAVRLLRQVVVPQDEVCFSMVDAPSLAAVREALDRVAMAYERIVEAVDVEIMLPEGSRRAVTR